MCAGAKKVSFCTFRIATTTKRAAATATTTTTTTSHILLEKVSLPE